MYSFQLSVQFKMLYPPAPPGAVTLKSHMYLRAGNLHATHMPYSERQVIRAELG